MRYGQKMKKVRMDYSCPHGNYSILMCFFQVRVHGKLQEKSPDRYKIIKLFNFRWFQSKGLKQVKAHRNQSRNIVTGGKRRYFASKL